MYTLHIANKNYSSWSLRPWILMKELAIPFEEILKPFAEGSNWQEFRQFSPSGTVPCLVESEAEQKQLNDQNNLIGDTVVWDSLAIVEYLAEAHQGVWPQNRVARAWARSAAAEMHSGFFALRETCSMTCGVRVQLRNYPISLSKDMARIDELWCEGLSRFGGPYLAGGQFSAVDAFFAPVIFRIQSFGLPLSDKASSYYRMMLENASLNQWYQQALAEPWREIGHDEAIAGVGTVIEDLRQ